MTIRTINLDSVSLATEHFGAEGDPAIVLVMGATASMLGWPDEMCEGLAAAGFFVLRYDHRDTGGSTTRPLGTARYSVEDMGGDLVGILDAHRIGAAHLVGMSLGGLICQMLALDRPDRVASLTLIGSEPLGWDGAALPHIDPRFLTHFAGMEDLDWRDNAAVHAFLLEIDRLCAGDAHGFDKARASARIDAVLARTPSMASAFNHASRHLERDWNGSYRAISQPVLVLHGEKDPILPLANGEALARGIPNARLAVMNDVGHELPREEIDAIVTEISAFAGTCEAARGKAAGR